MTNNDPSDFKVRLQSDGSIITVHEKIVMATRLRDGVFEVDDVILTSSDDTGNIVSLSRGSGDRNPAEIHLEDSKSKGDNQSAGTVDEASMSMDLGTKEGKDGQ